MYGNAHESRDSLKETRDHGTALFPLDNYDNYRRYPQYSRYSIYVHWHEELEMLFLRSGRARVRLNDRTEEITTEHLVVIPPGVIHSAESCDGGPFCFETVVFHPNMLDERPPDKETSNRIQGIASGSVVLRTPVRTDETWGAAVLHRLREIIELNEEKSPAYALGIKARLLDILYEFCSTDRVVAVETDDTSRNIERLKTVLIHIRNNYDQKINEDELAALSNLSKYHFIRVFKKVTGRTPVDYINHYRIHKAQQLLGRSSETILSIALSVGINDLSYFYRLFERYTGTSPGAYRRSLSPE